MVVSGNIFLILNFCHVGSLDHFGNLAERYTESFSRICPKKALRKHLSVYISIFKNWANPPRYDLTFHTMASNERYKFLMSQKYRYFYQLENVQTLGQCLLVFLVLVG